jgi:cell wall-associated NlpC family hydrolase
MKETIKLILIFGALMLLLGFSCFGQNQFADYTNFLRGKTDGDYLYVKVKNRTELIPNTDSAKLDAFIKDWLGVRYRLGGSTKRGIDCSQFTKKIYQVVYNKPLGKNCAEQWNQTKRIPKDSLKVSDIVFFRSTQSPSGWHCGLYIGDNRFVHAANRADGVKISSLDEPKYKRAYKGSGRLN